jgi:hypothetical protein
VPKKEVVQVLEQRSNCERMVFGTGHGCPANSSAYNAGAPSIWAAGAFGMHWGIYFLMRIKFRYQLLGLIFASFFDLERLFERHEFRVARKAQR